jgi:hypothetical protein
MTNVGKIVSEDGPDRWKIAITSSNRFSPLPKATRGRSTGSRRTLRKSGLPAPPTATLHSGFFARDVSELRVILKPHNKTEDPIPNKRFQTASLDRNTVVKACKRFRSNIEAVFAAEFSFIE